MLSIHDVLQLSLRCHSLTRGSSCQIQRPAVPARTPSTSHRCPLRAQATNDDVQVQQPQPQQLQDGCPHIVAGDALPLVASTRLRRLSERKAAREAAETKPTRARTSKKAAATTKSGPQKRASRKAQPAAATSSSQVAAAAGADKPTAARKRGRPKAITTDATPAPSTTSSSSSSSSSSSNAAGKVAGNESGTLLSAPLVGSSTAHPPPSPLLPTPPPQQQQQVQAQQQQLYQEEATDPPAPWGSLSSSDPFDAAALRAEWEPPDWSLPPDLLLSSEAEEDPAWMAAAEQAYWAAVGGVAGAAGGGAAAGGSSPWAGAAAGGVGGAAPWRGASGAGGRAGPSTSSSSSSRGSTAAAAAAAAAGGQGGLVPPSMLPGVAAWLAEAGEGEEDGEEGELASEAQEEELRQLLLEMQHPHPHPSQQQQEEEEEEEGGPDEQEWFGAHPSTTTSSSGTGSYPSLLDRPEGPGALFLPWEGGRYPGQAPSPPPPAAAGAAGGGGGGGPPLVGSSHPEVLEMVANKAHQLRVQIERCDDEVQSIGRIADIMEWLLEARLTPQQLALLASAATEAAAGPGRLQQLQEALARITLAVAAGRVELERLEAEVSPGVTSDGSPGADAAAASNWDQHFAALQRFVVGKGRLPYQEDTFENKYLGKWCRAQQLEFDKGHLSDTRVTALAGVPGWDWDTPIMQRYQAEAAQRRQEDRGQRRHVRQQQQQQQQVGRGSSRSGTTSSVAGGDVVGGRAEAGEQQQQQEEEAERVLMQQQDGKEGAGMGSSTTQQQQQQGAAGIVSGQGELLQGEPAGTTAGGVAPAAAAGAGSLSLQQPQQQQQQQETFWGQGGVDDILDALEQLLQDQGWEAAPVEGVTRVPPGGDSGSS